MIQPISLSQLAVPTKGDAYGENISFTNVAIDTRTLKKGDLYIALKGESFDGHQFVQNAIDKGCSGFVVERAFKAFGNQLNNIPYVLVDNTLKALGLCAKLNRDNFEGKVVGLTGSSGKTSTKNMLECILSESGSTCATHANFNNEVGVPLTLLNITNNHKFAVVEMGARKKGDIDYLMQLVQPDVSILLNAGMAHIDIFGSQQNIVRTKGEIFSSLKKDGLAVVNNDDPAKQAWLDSLQGKSVLTFSISDKAADVFASDIQSSELSTQFLLNFHGGSQPVFLPVPGLHNVANSLAAAAAAIHLGFDLQSIATGLAKLNASKGRLLSISCTDSLVVIDDSYNANPSSMRAAIDVLTLKRGIKVAVLGEMAELGDHSKHLHLELAKYISQSKLDKVYLLGSFAAEMAEIIGDNAQASESKEDILVSLIEKEKIFQEHNEPLESISVLIKGSRSTAMDELVDMIVKKAAH